MYGYELPDHPDVRAAERDGYPIGPRRIFRVCDVCGEEIYEGDEYYLIGDDVYCSECIDECRHEAAAEY